MSIRRYSSRNVVAILGDSPVICHAIAYLMDSGGYETRVIETVTNEAALSGVDLVITAAGTVGPVNPELRVCRNVIPVLKLVDTSEEKEAAGAFGLFWPCTARELQQKAASILTMADTNGAGEIGRKDAQAGDL